MLNPSTADAVQDDPTVRRCIGFAESFGCAELQVVNLFAYRAPKPSDLLRLPRDLAVGHGNDEYIVAAARAAKLVICAWGNEGAWLGRASEVLSLLRSVGVSLFALKINGATGEPAHPLYLPGSLQPFPLPA